MHDGCFEKLKDKLSSSLVLTLPKGNDGFLVYCDASRIRLGCVLMQHGRILANAFKQLKVHEKNYPTHYLKFLVMVFELKIWHHYLYGVQVDIFSYYKILQYVFT